MLMELWCTIKNHLHSSCRASNFLQMNKTRDTQKANTGFTLIELIITISVFSLAILSSFALAISNQRLAAENYDRVFAANIAREGIELVRNVRDSNWLAIDANQDCDPSPGLQLCTWDENLQYNFFTIDTADPMDIVDLSSCGVSFSSCMPICLGDNTCRLYRDFATGIYEHIHGGPETNMGRLIHLENICVHPDIDGSPDPNNADVIVPLSSPCVNGDPVGLKVTVRVAWERFNKSHYTEVVDYLYNWR